MKTKLFIVFILITFILVSCNNEKDIVPTDINNKPTDIPDISEIPYEFDLPDNVGVVTNNAYGVIDIIKCKFFMNI